MLRTNTTHRPILKIHDLRQEINADCCLIRALISIIHKPRDQRRLANCTTILLVHLLKTHRSVRQEGQA